MDPLPTWIVVKCNFLQTATLVRVVCEYHRLLPGCWEYRWECKRCIEAAQTRGSAGAVERCPSSQCVGNSLWCCFFLGCKCMHCCHLWYWFSSLLPPFCDDLQALYWFMLLECISVKNHLHRQSRKQTRKFQCSLLVAVVASAFVKLTPSSRISFTTFSFAIGFAALSCRSLNTSIFTPKYFSSQVSSANASQNLWLKTTYQFLHSACFRHSCCVVTDFLLPVFAQDSCHLSY